MDPAADDEPFLAFPANNDLRNTLVPYSDVLSHTCSTPRGAVGLPIRLLRCLVKSVMRPWLDIQTLFNQAVIKALITNEAPWRAHLEQLARHVRQQQAVVALLRSRLDEELEMRKPPRRTTSPISVRALEHVFLQTWLPRPPARLLELGDHDGSGLDFGALGYQVMTDNQSTADRLAKPAYPESAFDVVVCLPRSGGSPELLSAFHCGLRSGGRAIFSLNLDNLVAASELLPPSFRLLETAYVVSGDQDWTYTSDVDLVKSLGARGAVHGIALMAAEKN
jgi:hypothetical protein